MVLPFRPIHQHQRIRSFLFVALILLTSVARSQIVLSNGAPTYTQDLNSMGSGLVLPPSWRMHASTAAPSWSLASTSVTQQASSGSPTAGGTYNWGTSASERAAGAMTSGSFGSPNNLLAQFSNGGSSNITSLAISYQAERYRINTAPASIQFYWSLDGSSWTAVPSGDVAAASFPTGTSAYGFGPLTTVPVTGIVIPALAIPPGGSCFLRWNLNTTGANAQGIGIDDVTVTATFGGTGGNTVGFTSATSNVTEGGSAIIGVSMPSAPASDVVVSITNTLLGTASFPLDHSAPAPSSLTFPSGGTYPLTLNVTVGTVDDAEVEAAETVVLEVTVSSGPATVGQAMNTLSIADNDIVSITGCSSSQSPYLQNTVGNTTLTSLLTTGDQIGTYKMVGDPDGLGAFDNGNGTFTVLMNHELGTTQGVARAHGSIGAFVSKWVIDKNTLCVQSGQDLIQSVRTWNGSTFTSGTTTFGRFCSADLPHRSAFYNANTGRGTLERLFMNGEENGAEGRAFAHVVTGPNAGMSWQLPWLGRCNWENQVACPFMSDKTIVVGTDDATPGQVYCYIGTKQTTGTEVERAGLQNGHLFGVAVSGLATEVAGSIPAPNTAFTLVDLGDVHNLTGAQINTASNAANVTNFLRPEDSAWDPSHPNDLYFNTTASFTGPSRMWRLHFTDILQPELGGTITALLDGTEGQKMLDNMTIDGSGQILLQEDAGNQAHNAKVWRYDIATDALSLIAQHDPSRFITGGSNFLTQNEESSGILDVSHILGAGKFLLCQMAHYATTTELVEGGQLLLLTSTPIASLCTPVAAPQISGNTNLCNTDTLVLTADASGSPIINYSWTGPGDFLTGTQLPVIRVANPTSSTYAVNVSNGCGSSGAPVLVSIFPPPLLYADVDGDGFGDPAAPLTVCDPPPGYVSNGTDNCPSLFGRIGDNCDDGNSATVNDAIDATCTCTGTTIAVALQLRMLLEGPYVTGAGLMHDSLRTKGLIPFDEPYTALGYPHVSGGGESTTPAVFQVNGANAIVDWVVVEVRSAATPSSVLATRSALLQRDGDVVAADGVSDLLFPVPPGTYHVAVRHRNHLGCMTATAVSLGTVPVLVDFSLASTSTYGTEARKNMGPVMALWGGNVLRDADLKYTGPVNDRSPILSRIGGVLPTNTVMNAYLIEDANLDGAVKYTGTGNDRGIILSNIGGVVPTNTRVEQLP